jgi:hypothetical protein
MAKEKNEPEAATPAPEKISFHAAILQADGTFSTEAFETLPELVARIKNLIDRDVSVFAFAGTRLKISKPPMRHLLVPGQEPIPLFDAVSSFEEDDTGYLGVDPINLDPPPQLKVAQSNRPGPTDDFFEDDDGGLGVFGSPLPDPDG